MDVSVNFLQRCDMVGNRSLVILRKYQKHKISCHLLIGKTFLPTLFFFKLGFTIGEYNWLKTKGGGGEEDNPSKKINESP